MHHDMMELREEMERMRKVNDAVALDGIEEVVAQAVREGMAETNARIDAVSATLQQRIRAVTDRVDALAGEMRGRMEGMRRDQRMGR